MWHKKLLFSLARCSKKSFRIAKEKTTWKPVCYKKEEMPGIWVIVGKNEENTDSSPAMSLFQENLKKKGGGVWLSDGTYHSDAVIRGVLDARKRGDSMSSFEAKGGVATMLSGQIDVEALYKERQITSLVQSPSHRFTKSALANFLSDLLMSIQTLPADFKLKWRYRHGLFMVVIESPDVSLDNNALDVLSDIAAAGGVVIFRLDDIESETDKRLISSADHLVVMSDILNGDSADRVLEQIKGVSASRSEALREAVLGRSAPSNNNHLTGFLVDSDRAIEVSFRGVKEMPVYMLEQVSSYEKVSV